MAFGHCSTAQAQTNASSALSGSITADISDSTLLAANPNRPLPPQGALDVSLSVWDAGIPIDQAQHQRKGIYPQVRRAESIYFPLLLRKVLHEDNSWGDVRLVPEQENTAELMVSGKILQANGQQLAIRIIAQDSSGRIWLNRRYSAQYGQNDYRQKEAYLPLFRSLNQDLKRARASLSDKQIKQLPLIAELRYAAALAPDTFSSYINEQNERYSYVRLPATDDPMLLRIQALHQQEDRFFDAMDKIYLELMTNFQPRYSYWRQQNLAHTSYLQQQSTKQQSSGERSGSYTSLSHSYGNYRRARVQQENLEQLAEGFNNELSPTVVALDDRVIHLNGSFDTQYREWKRILQQLYKLEVSQ